jgi:hypothetical protein
MRDKLWGQWMPQLQNQLELLGIDPRSAKAKVNIREKDAAWADGNGPLRFCHPMHVVAFAGPPNSLGGATITSAPRRGSLL